MMKSILSGTFPVLPTIYDAQGAVDPDGMRRVLEYIADAGADGVVFPGLASEYDQLDMQERLDLITVVGDWCRDRIQFIVGASAATADASSQIAARGAAVGAVTAMIMTPHEFDGDFDALKRFYSDVGDRAGIPIMLQNAPRPMGIALHVDQVVALADAVEAIAYIKEETAPCGQRISSILHKVETIDGVFGGAGGRQLIDELRRGSSGTLPACEITELHVALVRAFQAGDEQQARQLFDRSLPLLMMQAGFRWRLTKDVLRRRGLITSTVTRAPGPELDPGDFEELTILLERLSDVISLNEDAAKAIVE